MANGEIRVNKVGTDTQSITPTRTNNTAETGATNIFEECRITVDDWGTGENDCLSNIVKNNYNINPYSQEGREIMNSIMEANPEIYASGRKGIVNGQVQNVDDNSLSTMLYTGETINLPAFGGVTQPSDTNKTPTDNSTDKPNGESLNPAAGEADGDVADKNTDTGKTPTDNSTDKPNGESLNPAAGEADGETTGKDTGTGAVDNSKDKPKGESVNPAAGEADGDGTVIKAPTFTGTDTENNTKETTETNTDTKTDEENESKEKPSILKGIGAGIKGIFTKGIGGIINTVKEHPIATGVGVAATAAALAFVPVVGWAAIGVMGVVGAGKAIVDGAKEIGEISESYKEGDAEAFYENCEDLGGNAFDLGLSVAGTASAVKGVKSSVAAAKTAGTIFRNPLSGAKDSAGTVDDIAGATDDAATGIDDAATGADDATKITTDTTGGGKTEIITDTTGGATTKVTTDTTGGTTSIVDDTAGAIDDTVKTPAKDPVKVAEEVAKNKNTMKSEMGQTEGLSHKTKVKLNQPKYQRMLEGYQNTKKYPTAKLEKMLNTTKDPLEAEIIQQALNLRTK